VSEHGDAIINGDQIYGTEAELLAAAVHDDDVPRKRSVSVSPVSSLKWPNGEIFYKWDPALDNARKDTFLKAVKVWTDRLPSIKFTLSNDPKARNIRPIAGDWSFSPVGCCGGNLDVGDTANVRVLVHELGHSK